MGIMNSRPGARCMLTPRVIAVTMHTIVANMPTSLFIYGFLTQVIQKAQPIEFSYFLSLQTLTGLLSRNNGEIEGSK
jgi:hypothetical protein